MVRYYHEPSQGWCLTEGKGRAVRRRSTPSSSAVAPSRRTSGPRPSPAAKDLRLAGGQAMPKDRLDVVRDRDRPGVATRGPHGPREHADQVLDEAPVLRQAGDVPH